MSTFWDRMLNMVTPKATAQTTQLGRVEADCLSILSILQQNATQNQQSHAQLVSLLDTINATLAAGIAAIIAKLDTIIGDVNGTAPDGSPASVRFVVPTHRDIKTGKSLHMATSLLNDVISNITLEFDNLAGQVVNAPSGGTVTLSVVDASGNPSSVATAGMGSDGMSVDVVPTPGDGSNMAEFTVMFEDQANADLKASLDCVFTNDTNAANVHFRTDQITTRPIPPAGP